MPPVKLLCVILLAGFFRLILGGNFKIALVLGVICIGSRASFSAFFFCFCFIKAEMPPPAARPIRTSTPKNVAAYFVILLPPVCSEPDADGDDCAFSKLT